MKIAIFGGDKRMLFAARAFASDGYEVLLAGFDTLMSLCEIRVCTVEEAADECDCAVLPIRPVKDNHLNAPFASHPIDIAALLARLDTKPVFTGCSALIRPYSKGTVYDYTDDEDFTLRNAELTAEGAIELILREYEGAICGTEMLVTGCGRIGKVLTRYLSALGAKVTVAARNPADRKLVMENGINAVDYPDINFADYQVIINTVPAMVMDQNAVDRMRDDVFIIDLASIPGGVDFNAAHSRDLTCFHALSLPGKTAPLTAGIIIKDTIMNILNREAYLE